MFLTSQYQHSLLIIHYHVLKAYIYSSEIFLKSPIYNKVIEDVGQLPNGRTFKITVVLVSEQNGDVKESESVSTFFRTRTFTF